MNPRRPLVLTGGPAVGTTTTGRALASARPAGAYVDVLDPVTVALHRERLPGVLVVHLLVPFEEARRRATTRPVWLTEEEFTWLHRRDAADPPAADVRLDVGGLDPSEQAAAVEEVWARR